MLQNKMVIKRILGLIRPYLHYLIFALFFAIITVALTLYAPILTGQALDLIIGKGNVDFIQLIPILVRFAVIVGMTFITQWLMSLCTNKITYYTVKDFRNKVFHQLEIVPLKYIDANQHGDILSRVITDVDQFADGLLLGFTQLFTGIVTIVATLGFMLSIHVEITLIVVIITPISLFVASFIANRTYKMFRLQSEIRGEQTSFINEMVGNQKVVQAFGQEKQTNEKFEQISERLRVCSIRATFFSSLTNPCTRFVNGLVYTSVGIIGAFTAMRGFISIGQLSCFLSYANQYTKPFNEISSVITELQGAIASAKRVFEVIDETPQTPDMQDAVYLENVKGMVELKEVSFSYNPEITLIEQLNLKVESGQKIAIVGPTGCGKTTIINLLMRFYDTDSGVITIDGYPIKEIQRNNLRNHYGMVLQETWLKEGTIRENIAYGKSEATLEEVIEAAKSSYAHSFIKRMPNGYDTIISEDGGNISQGQKQLLCIARVMLTLPPMLILDEATSSIDTRTEIKIQKAFAKMMHKRTSFIVAHRLSTIKEADVILVMKEGHIIEQGNHESLLKKGGFYTQLYNSQFAIQ